MERSTTVTFQGERVEGVELDFKTTKEEWNEYQTTDGSIVRLKVVVISIVRLKDKYDNDNNPIYIVKASNVVSASTPEKLKKGTLVS